MTLSTRQCLDSTFDTVMVACVEYYYHAALRVAKKSIILTIQEAVHSADPAFDEVYKRHFNKTTRSSTLLTNRNLTANTE